MESPNIDLGGTSETIAISTQSANVSNPATEYSSELLDAAEVCLIIFTLVGSSGNLITILALSRIPQLRNATTAFVINLAFADMLFCTFLCPVLAVIAEKRQSIITEGGSLCTLVAFLIYANMIISFFTVIAITINRYVCIVHHTWYATIYSQRNVVIMIAALWVSGFTLLSLPLFKVWGRYGYQTPSISCDILPQNLKSPKSAINYAILILPTLSFILCYCQIYRVVRRASKKVLQKGVPCSTVGDLSSNIAFKTFAGRSLDSPSTSMLRLALEKIQSRVNPATNEGAADTQLVKRKKNELKVLKVVLVVSIAYVLCFFPSSIIAVYQGGNVGPIPSVLAYLLSFFGNCINPFIYVALSAEYRRAFFRLLSFGKNDTAQSDEVTTDSQTACKVKKPGVENS